jgi:HK97 family phage major capsid protein
MSQKLRSLQAKKAALVSDMRAITNVADAAGRDLDDVEAANFANLKAQLESTNAAMTRETDLIAEEARMGIAQALPAAVTDNREADAQRGFKSFGEFAQAVRSAAIAGNRPDDRLLIGAAAPSPYGGESVGTDGGFAVPPQFSQEIWHHSLGEDSLLPFTDNTEVTGNSMVFPKDETTPWGSDGVRAYWQAEAGVVNATKPKLSTTTLRLQKLMALIPLTDELLADTNALQSYLPSKVGDSIRWKTNEAILWGAGNGLPQGVYQGNASVIVAKESGQATLTLQAMNLAKMIARLPAGSFANAVWIVNNDVLPALWTLTMGNIPGYVPFNQGLQDSPYGSLFGRPIIVSQHAKSFSSQGDILLCDLSYYRTITKAEGIQTATSMHLYFDADATAFRTTFRIDGQPKIINPIAPANGSNNLSPFLQLGAR